MVLSLIVFLAISLGVIVREGRVRRALREARAVGNDLRLAVDTIPTIVWITEPDGAVTFMNRAWRDFTGFSVEDVARGRWVETLHPDEAEWVQTTRNVAVAAGRAYELDARLRRADGSYRWVLRRAVPLRNDRGEIVRWYGTGTDIDDLKRAEAALRDSEASLAEEHRRALTARFTAALAERTRLAREIHDTLLQGFTGVALQLTAMARREREPGTVAALRQIVGQAERALDDARKAVWDLREPVNVSESFSASLQRFAVSAIAGTELDLEFEVRGTERLLAPEVQAAATRVLRECIANVVKHASARSIRVCVRYDAHDLELSMSDDGKGFELDPTFRAYGAHWGLLGMKERASELRGALTVRSALGQGTTVVLRLPYSVHTPVLA